MPAASVRRSSNARFGRLGGALRLAYLVIALLAVALLLNTDPARGQAENDTQSSTDVSGQTLRIATKPLEPFVFIDDDELRGFSIDYWNEVASRLGVETEWVELVEVSDVIDAVAAGEVDAGIAGISITPEREAIVDFSQPYYNSGRQIATRSSTGASTVTTLFNLIKSGTFLVPLLILIGLIFLVSHLVWWFERGYDDDFPQDYRTGIVEALWWSTVSVITGGEAVKDINRPWSRIVAIFWLLLGLFLLAFVTARATSVLTVAELESDIASVADLQGKDVGTVVETSTVDFLQDDVGVTPEEYATLAEALDELAAGDIDAVVFDAPVISYLISTDYQGSGLQLLEATIGRDPYGIALPTDSELTEIVNRTVIEIDRDGTLDDLLAEWFG